MKFVGTHAYSKSKLVFVNTKVKKVSQPVEHNANSGTSSIAGPPLIEAQNETNESPITIAINLSLFSALRCAPLAIRTARLRWR